MSEASFYCMYVQLLFDGVQNLLSSVFTQGARNVYNIFYGLQNLLNSFLVFY